MVRRAVTWIALTLLGLGVAVGMVTDHSYVTTPSMYPTIPPGSEIFVSHTKDVHVGQVIEFRANGLTWAHRLIKINPDGTLVTKGDNPENAPDVFIPPLTRADVIGVVTHAPRWLGFPELIVHEPSYGLAWLRAELGVPGRVLLCLAVGLASFAAVSRKQRGNHPQDRAEQQETVRFDRTDSAVPSSPDTAPTTLLAGPLYRLPPVPPPGRRVPPARDRLGPCGSSTQVRRPSSALLPRP